MATAYSRMPSQEEIEKTTREAKARKAERRSLESEQRARLPRFQSSIGDEMQSISLPQPRVGIQPRTETEAVVRDMQSRSAPVSGSRSVMPKPEQAATMLPAPAAAPAPQGGAIQPPAAAAPQAAGPSAMRQYVDDWFSKRYTADDIAKLSPPEIENIKRNKALEMRQRPAIPQAQAFTINEEGKRVQLDLSEDDDTAIRGMIRQGALDNVRNISLPQPSKAALAFLAARGVGTAQRQVMSDPQFSDAERLGVFEERAGNAAFSGSDRRAAGRTAQGIQGRIAMREANANRLAVAERNEAAAQATGEAEATTRLAPELARLTGKLQATESEFKNAEAAWKDRLKTEGGVGANMLNDPDKMVSAITEYMKMLSTDPNTSPETIDRLKKQSDIIIARYARRDVPQQDAPAAPGGGGVQPPAPTETTEKRYTPAEARKLPPGTIYVGTDGVKRRV
jgi:hypothetical protein